MHQVEKFDVQSSITFHCKYINIIGLDIAGPEDPYHVIQMHD